MKVLFSLISLVCVLGMSSISLAQDADSNEEIELYPTMPTGETAIGKDGIVYVAYTKEQNDQIEKAYRDFDKVTDLAFQMSFTIDILNDELGAMNLQLTIARNENKELWNQISKLRLENTTFKEISKAQKRNTGAAIVASVLIGLGSGFLGGFATGRALESR